MLQSMGWQRVRHNLKTEQQQKQTKETSQQTRRLYLESAMYQALDKVHWL